MLPPRQHNQVPAAMDKSLEQIVFREDGGMYLGASSMNTRYWKGSLWFYSNPDAAPDRGLSTAGVDVGSGVTDLSTVERDSVLLSTDTGSLELWRMAEQDTRFEQVLSARNHDTIVSSISVNSRKTCAVSCDYDGCIKHWDLGMLQQMFQYRAHADIVWDVCYHPEDPSLFLSCSQDGCTYLFDTRSKSPAVSIESKSISRPTSVAWRGKGQSVAIGGESGCIEIKDLRSTSEAPLCFKPHQRVVHRMAFCPGSESVLASVSEDCSAVVTRLDGSECKQIYSHTFSDFVHGLTWKDSSRFYTCSWDKKVKCHNYLSPETCMDTDPTDSRLSYADKLKNK